MNRQTVLPPDIGPTEEEEPAIIIDRAVTDTPSPDNEWKEAAD
jgi:hypothetical protein